MLGGARGHYSVCVCVITSGGLEQVELRSCTFYHFYSAELKPRLTVIALLDSTDPLTFVHTHRILF